MQQCVAQSGTHFSQVRSLSLLSSLGNHEIDRSSLLRVQLCGIEATTVPMPVQQVFAAFLQLFSMDMCFV